MRKAATEFLNREWLNILESLDDAVLVASRSGSLEFMNEAGALLTGLSAARSMGRPITEVLSATPWIVELIEATQTTGVRNVRADSVLQQMGGSRKRLPVRAAATLLVNDTGTAIGSLLTLQDLSYQRELESRSREFDRLQQLEVLVAGLAHEVKNPLSGMRGAAQILARAVAETARTRECTDIILREIDRLNDLIAQLLDLAGPAKLRRQAVNIHQLLDLVLKTLSAGTDKDISFIREFDPSLPPVRGDRDRLTQVLLNLLGNAVDASSTNDRITLRTRMDTTYWVAGEDGRDQFISLDVCDEGMGIAEADLSSIFNPFFTTKDDGTGLGLSISQRIITEHGGVLRVRRRASRGTVFTLTLPIDRTDGND
jgi:two-component system nitrogen regulation sensor histidine kinase GlnL